MVPKADTSFKEVVGGGNLSIIVTPEQMASLLKGLGHPIDSEGYVLDQMTKDRVLAIDGDDIKTDEVAAVLPGSEVLLRKNIASYSEYLRVYKKKI